MKRAIFLDRDGTLNPDPGYISNPDDFELFPGVVEALKKLYSAGFLLVIVTNQSGLSRGLIKEEQLQSIHQKLKKILKISGIELAGIYYCPHHPDFTYIDGLADCECRKPKPGLIYKAIEELEIDPVDSFMIGDKLSDIEAAINAGVSPVFIGNNLPQKYRTVPNFLCLNDAADWILAGEDLYNF